MEGVRMMPICHHFPLPFSTSSWGVLLSFFADNERYLIWPPLITMGKNAGIMFVNNTRIENRATCVNLAPAQKRRTLDTNLRDESHGNWWNNFPTTDGHNVLQEVREGQKMARLNSKLPRDLLRLPKCATRSVHLHSYSRHGFANNYDIDLQWLLSISLRQSVNVTIATASIVALISENSGRTPIDDKCRIADFSFLTNSKCDKRYSLRGKAKRIQPPIPNEKIAPFSKKKGEALSEEKCRAFGNRDEDSQ